MQIFFLWYFPGPYSQNMQVNFSGDYFIYYGMRDEILFSNVTFSFIVFTFVLCINLYFVSYFHYFSLLKE